MADKLDARVSGLPLLHMMSGVTTEPEPSPVALARDHDIGVHGQGTCLLFQSFDTKAAEAANSRQLALI